jgi:hypothetical protein
LQVGLKGLPVTWAHLSSPQLHAFEEGFEQRGASVFNPERSMPWLGFQILIPTAQAPSPGVFSWSVPRMQKTNCPETVGHT